MPSKTLAAVQPLLLVIRNRLLELCDLNSIVKEIKRLSAADAAQQRAGSSSGEPGGDGQGQPQQDGSSSAKQQIEALWEEAKIRSLSRVIAAVYVVSALTCMIRAHLTLFARLSAASRAHYVDTKLQENQAADGADGASVRPASALAAAAAEAEYDQQAQARQESCLRALCDVMLGPGLDNLLRHVRTVVTVITSTPAYQVTSTATSAATTMSPSHFTGLLIALLSAADAAPSTGSAAGSGPDVYAPSVVLGCLFPSHSAAATIAVPHEPSTSSTGGISAAALIALATGNSAHTRASPSVPPMLWSAQLLCDLTIDSVRSPPFQAAFRQSCRDVVSQVVQGEVRRLVFGIQPPHSSHSNPLLQPPDPAAALASSHHLQQPQEREKALGSIVVSLRAVADILLAGDTQSQQQQLKPLPGSATTDGLDVSTASIATVTATPSPVGPSAVAVACDARPLSELCYQLMWNASMS